MLDKIIYGITIFYSIGIVYRMCYADVKLYRKQLGIPKIKQDIKDMLVAIEHIRGNRK